MNDIDQLIHEAAERAVEAVLDKIARGDLKIPQTYYNTAEAAEYLRMKPRALEDMRTRKTGPEYLRPDHRTVRYTREQLDAYMHSRSE